MKKKDKHLHLKNQQQIKETLQDYCQKGGHSLPQTRREFLASGLLSLSATVMAPTLHGMIANRAYASCETANASLPPFIQISLAGGAALCANFLAGDEQGNRLSSYRRMGLGDNPTSENLFSNAAPFARNSGFPTGIKARTTSQTRSKTAFCAMAAFSFDDTADNEQNIIGLVSAAGNAGQFLPTTLTSSQIRNQGQIQVSNAKYFTSPAFLPPSSPLRVSGVSSLVESLTLATPGLASVTESLTSSQKVYKALFSLVNDLSQSQLKKLQARNPSTEEFKKLIQCANDKNFQFTNQGLNLPNLDISKEPGLSSLWTSGSEQEKNKILGSVVLSTLKKVSGPAFIQLGGYDYHQGAGSRQKSNEMDQFAGELVGRILSSAAQLNTPVFIYITSDGSTFCPDSASNTVGFTGDRATHGLSFMIAFHPSQPPQMDGYAGSPSYQLNHFDSKGLEVNTSHMVGKNVPISSASAFANYLSFANQISLLNQRPQLRDVMNALSEAGSVNQILRFKG